MYLLFKMNNINVDLKDELDHINFHIIPLKWMVLNNYLIKNVIIYITTILKAS